MGVRSFRLQEHSAYGPSQWETTLHCNVDSHWLSPYPEWCLGLAVMVNKWHQMYCLNLGLWKLPLFYKHAFMKPPDLSKFVNLYPLQGNNVDWPSSALSPVEVTRFPFGPLNVFVYISHWAAQVNYQNRPHFEGDYHNWWLTGSLRQNVGFPVRSTVKNFPQCPSKWWDGFIVLNERLCYHRSNKTSWTVVNFISTKWAHGEANIAWQ